MDLVFPWRANIAVVAGCRSISIHYAFRTGENGVPVCVDFPLPLIHIEWQKYGRIRSRQETERPDSPIGIGEGPHKRERSDSLACLVVKNRGPLAIGHKGDTVALQALAQQRHNSS